MTPKEAKQPVPLMLSSGARPRGLTLWFTGLSAAGKTTLNDAVRQCLREQGYAVESLDGDVLRQNLWKDLGFTKEDRDENIRRIGFVADLLSKNGIIVLVSAISPYRAARDQVRGHISDFVEIYVNAPLEVCEKRDRKGLYRKARTGELSGFTGVNDPYEAPLHPEVVCHTDRETVAESADKIMRYLEARPASIPGIKFARCHSNCPVAFVRSLRKMLS